MKLGRGPLNEIRKAGGRIRAFSWVFVFTLIVFTVVPAFAVDADGEGKREGGYRVGAGDILDISVWKDPELTKTVAVLPDGTITFPLIDQVQAAGKSVPELRSEISRRLDPFVPEPVVSVVVHQVTSMTVYVIGEVNRPGRYNLACRINVLQLLSMAGGLKTFAKDDEIRIFRKNGENERMIPFCYDDVVDGRDLAQNIELMRGDVIVVP